MARNRNRERALENTDRTWRSRTAPLACHRRFVYYRNGLRTSLRACVAAAQASAKIYRIGWLDHGGPPPAPIEMSGTFSKVARRWLCRRKNVAVEYRYASGNPEQLGVLAAELVRLPVDVIVTSGEPAAVAAKRATSTIPIVMTEIGIDPVRAGLVASLARRRERHRIGIPQQRLMAETTGTAQGVCTQPARVAVLWIRRIRAMQTACKR
jgi:putative ABC transport system substrate-binding protein